MITTVLPSTVTPTDGSSQSSTRGHVKRNRLLILIGAVILLSIRNFSQVAPTVTNVTTPLKDGDTSSNSINSSNSRSNNETSDDEGEVSSAKDTGEDATTIENTKIENSATSSSVADEEDKIATGDTQERPSQPPSQQPSISPSVNPTHSPSELPTIPTIIATANTTDAVGIVNNVTTLAPYSFAYVFLVAGCKPEDPSYLGFLYNVLIAKELFSMYNSTADVVALIRMHANVTDETLPDNHLSMLTKLGIKVKYIPKPKVDNFHTAMMDKFRILQLEEYDRVIYLDSDIMPLNNLDYVFENSVGPNATIEENLILAHSREPANGGFFMLKPGKGEYDELRKIVAPMEVPGYRFDIDKGFGHPIVKPDCWQSIWTCQQRWKFYGAFTDQGMLYHWTKYVKKKVTQIVKNEALIFREDDNGNVTMVARVNKATLFQNVTEYGHLRTEAPITIAKLGRVYTDFMHFFLGSKPWLQEAPPLVESINQTTTPLELWYFVLREINEKYDLRINTESISITKTPLGHEPTLDMLKINGRIRRYFF